MSAQDLLPTIGSDVESYAENNEFLALVRAGKATREQFQRLLIGEYQCAGEEISVYGTLLTRHRHEVPAGLFSFTVYQLTEARKRLLRGTVQSMDLSLDELARLPVDPRMQRINELIAWIALHAGPAEGALWARADFERWCATCRRLAEAARTTGTVPEPVIAYLDAYARVPQELLDATLETADYGLEHGESEELAVRSARKLESAMDSFWDLVING
ncbi:hypothetical protein ACFYWU_17800 [Streptomyces chrestomyceticus]|uniref:hypothetical protein n=1 Tax=Streptomyces chrestomyceticus TaxID=68185 RepID=UPI0036B06ED3